MKKNILFPIELILDKTLSDPEFRLLSFLIKDFNHDKNIPTSINNEELAYGLSISNKTIQNMISSLKNKEYIFVFTNESKRYIATKYYDDNYNHLRGNITNYKTYLMYDYNCKLYKIGKSKNPKIRENTLSGQLPKIKLFAICEKNIEIELHKKYKNKRVRGEWFSLNDNDVEDIIKLGFIN